MDTPNMLIYPSKTLEVEGWNIIQGVTHISQLNQDSITVFRKQLRWLRLALGLLRASPFNNSLRLGAGHRH